MKHDVSIAAQCEEIRQLIADGSEVSSNDEQLKAEYRSQSAASKKEYVETLESVQREVTEETELLDSALTDKLEEARLVFEESVERLNNVRNQKSDDASRERADEIKLAKRDLEATQLQLKDILDGDLETTQEQQKTLLAKCEACRQELERVAGEVNEFLAGRGLPAIAVKTTAAASADWSSTCLRRFSSSVQVAESEVTLMRRWPLIRSLDGLLSFALVLIFAAVLWFPVGLLLNYEPIFWIPAVLIGTIAVTVVYRLIAQRHVARTVNDRRPGLDRHLTHAAESLIQAIAASARETKAAQEEQRSQYLLQLTSAKDESVQRTDRAEREFIDKSQELENSYGENYQEVEENWERQTGEIRSHFGPRIDALRQRLESTRQDLTLRQQQRQDELRADFESRNELSRERWRQRLLHFQAFHEFAEDSERAHSIAWSQVDWDQWSPSVTLPDVVPLGRCEFDVERFVGGAAKALTSDASLTSYSLPSFLTFPNDASLLIRASGEGRAAAVRVLQNAMLRMLVTLPPGKVRFTIFDPTGLGQNFSAFMHLADHDERLVGRRIWTESTHIQQRLTDLTEHMENVIQKYLRNEFSSIQDYNEHAGEVAEPFRILVAANFPSHFDEESTRRLISIANSGPRCGVYTLISVDEGASFPRHIQLQDLEAHANVLAWSGDRFHWDCAPLAQLPLELDDPPEDDLMTSIIKAVGRHAEKSNRVEVPFSSVSPPPEEWWQKDCADELTVPLGRAGATQHLAIRLGRGTSQHVLISGKTGSGKSTLLHALITNASLAYSPDQLHFYLIDFKKGVEFKPYADLDLPHARVVAIESEREFGLSVLQRLDEELRRRGDLFRSSSVQSLAAYREAMPDQPMPRILLIVDEFQEFFVSDDKIAHEASLLMDRLVRQGRAFGMHLVLGSQTLAGAYTLARSTIGQMAVRIALQCSAADAHLILSEDNTAARLLGRPGEAIYNDANGLMEGNHPFQVVWLPDAQRAEYLRRIREMSAERSLALPPTIVFEGHAAADLRENSHLEQRLTLGPTAESAHASCAWLGSAVAIKEPTSVIFRPQGGTNLLIVGQNQELAAGIMLSSLVSLAAARPRRNGDDSRRSATFYVLDGEYDQDGAARLEHQLDVKLPVDISFGGPRDSKQVVERLVEQVRQRAESSKSGEPVYLLISDLARFRDLKPSADDYGFSSFGDEKAANSAGQLAEILRDGPAVGVHVLVWSDSYNSVSRWFERSILRDFAFRVLFQMSAGDSSNLMDSAAAGHLGQYRALFYNDDRGESEKFRPYGPPSRECLGWISQQLAQAQSQTSDDNQGPAAPESSSLV